MAAKGYAPWRLSIWIFALLVMLGLWKLVGFASLYWTNLHVPLTTVPGTHGSVSTSGDYNVAVVPTRWRFRFRDGDHHLGETRLRLAFEGFDKGEGLVTWHSSATLKDQTSDHKYNW